MGVIFNSVSFYLAAVIFVLCSVLYYYIKRKLNYFNERGILHLDNGNFVQDFISILIGKTHMFARHNSLYQALRGNKFGGFFDFNLPNIMVRDPELIERILVKDFTHFYDRGFSIKLDNDPLNQNLFNLDGELWRHMRYKLTPTFTTGKLKGMFEQMCNCGGNIVREIEKESKIDENINTDIVLRSFALDVIATCAFGIQLNEDDSMKEKFRQMMKGVVKPSIKQMLKILLLLNVPKVCNALRIKGTPQDVEDFVLQLVSDTLKLRKESKIHRNDFLQLMYNLQKHEESGTIHQEEEEQIEHDDVIDQLKHAGGSEKPQIKQKLFTDDCIAAQSFVFLLGGTESVSGSLAYILFCLTQNLDVQEKLHEEIRSVIDSNGSKWSYKAVKEMTYLDSVIQESQRMYPVVQELQRICTEPYKIPNTDITIEKGVRVMIPVYCIHNDPENYPSPETYDPERFADNNFKPSGIYLPFGNGPRVCIAMRFALLELKVCVARIVSEFTVKLSPKTKLPLEQDPKSFFLSPVGGFWFQFQKRS